MRARATGYLRLFLVAVVMMPIALSLPAVAQQNRVERTPSDNDNLRLLINSQFAAFLSGTAAGFIPEPIISLSGEVLATTTDATLKFTPPQFGRITDKRLEPNAALNGQSEICVREFTLQQFQAQHKNLFGFTYKLVPEEQGLLGRVKKQGYWGPLLDPGEMFVFHQNSDVTVTLDHPLVPKDEDLYPLTVQLPEGRHAFTWQAETQLNPVLDIALPVVLIPIFIRSEATAGGAFSKFFSDRKVLKEIIENPGNARYVDEAIAAGIRSDITQELLEFWGKHATKELKSLAKTEGGTLAAEATGLLPEVSFARNSFTQSVTVLDTHTPTISTSEPDKTLEASDLGGTRLVRVYDELLATLDHSDVCGRPTRVFSDAPNILPVGEETTITWTVTDLDDGQAEADFYKTGVSSTAAVQQRVTVVDTLPPLMVAPAGKVVESAGATIDPAGVDLGWPMVIDLADPDPVITNDAPAAFANDTRLAVDWTATDDSGNASHQVQWLTAKHPGTNQPPSVAATQSRTRTAETVEIRLDGIDPDVLPTSRGFDIADPLSFEIVDYPDNGQFEAPLRPFFIEDFRLTPIGETEVKGARTSPLGDNAAEFAALPDPADPRSANEQRGDFLIERYCNVGEPIPLNFVFQPTYVHVMDDGTYYVRDKFWDCANAADIALDFPGDRISQWTRDREFVSEFRMTDLDCVQSDVFTVDAQENIWWTDCGPDFSTFLSVQDIQKVDRNFENYEFYRFSEQPEVNGFKMFVKAVHADTQAGLLFVNNNQGVQVYRRGNVELLGQLDINGEVNFLAQQAEPDTNEPLCQGRDLIVDGWVSRRYWITTDQDSNLYMSDACRDIIHKFRPSRIDSNGEFKAGEYVGWLGRCDANVPPWNGCDESKGVSRGFTCADDKCTRAGTFGNAPGQFQQPTHLAVDPNNILYVADFGNLRVQRFGSAGTFAGQAVSTGSGINAGEDPGFVLGNMGPPTSVSVNSSSFYVMEAENDADFFLHSFKTIPFHMIDAVDGEVDQDGDGYADNSVILKYTSDFNFPGSTGRPVADDHFTYRVNDGLADSPVSEGVVTVQRNFRPPGQLAIRCYDSSQPGNEVQCDASEDADLIVELVAEDPDGVLGFDGLDVLSYSIVDETGSGSLQLQSENNGTAFYLYTPDPDFYGTESFRFSVTDNTTVRPDGLVSVDGGFSFNVLPVPDPPVLSIDPLSRAGRGFPVSLTARYSDVDRDPAEPDPIVNIVWGDGTVELQGDVVDLGNGEYEMSGPVLSTTKPGAGTIFASHTYLDTGGWPAIVCLDSVDSPTPICESKDIDVVSATKVTGLLSADVPSPPVGTTFTVSLEVTNQLPEGWSGLDAPGVSAVIDLPPELDPVSLDPRCAVASTLKQISCALGDFAPGQTATLNMLLLARPGIRPVPSSVIVAEIFHAAFDVNEEILADTTISVQWIDTDGDGLPDAWELVYFRSLGASADGDPDNDGLSNLDEYFAQADPNMADTDADGKTDREEYERYFTNPANPDTDGDGMPDGWEIDVGLDPSFADADADADEDGLTNAQEYALDFDPLDPDMDDDELLDGGDNCPQVANAPQRDADADTQGDACDVYSVIDLRTARLNVGTGVDVLAELRAVAAGNGDYESWVEVFDEYGDDILGLYPAAPSGQDVLELQVLQGAGGDQLVISSERRSDRWPSITVVAPLTGALVSQINTLPVSDRLLATRPLRGDADGIRRLALLANNSVTESLEVKLVGADSGVVEHLLDLPGAADPGWTRTGLARVAAGAAEAVAVFASGDTGQGVAARIVVVQVTDGAIVADIAPETAGLEAIEMQAVPDVTGDGWDEVALRLRRLDDSGEIIQVFDVQTGTRLSSFVALESAAAAGGAAIYHLDVIGTGRETAIAIFSVGASGDVAVSIRDILSGNEIYAPAFSGRPSSYRNAESVLPDVGGATTRELAVVLENTETGQHRIEIRDIETGTQITEVQPEVPTGSGGGMFGRWILAILLMFALLRVSRLARVWRVSR